jgi:hypothetical protein
MKKIINWIKDNPNRTMFLVPILLVAAISISHVVTWYDIANPLNWAIYLSIAIEVAAMTALVAATNKIKGGVWFMFGTVTLVQMIGNIFYSFKEIDETSELFKSWVELTGPIWEMFGTEPGDLISLKRWLSFLEGGLLPIISLTSLHFFVKYDTNNSSKNEVVTSDKKIINDTPNDDITDDQIENLTDLQIQTKKIWDKVRELKDSGKLDEVTEQDIDEEPSALAFTPYETFDETLNSEDIIPEIPSKEENVLDDFNLSENDIKILSENIENAEESEESNEIIVNALKKYKESKTKKSGIERIN